MPEIIVYLIPSAWIYYQFDTDLGLLTVITLYMPFSKDLNLITFL